MLFSKTLFRYRDLNKQAENIFSMKPDERVKLLSEIEKEDKKITKSETLLKNTGNFMGLIGTAAIAAATYLASPVIPLAFGAASLVGAIYAVSAGATIETQRNQSQTDTIRRILYKQKEKGYDLDNGKQSKADVSRDRNKNNRKENYLVNRDIADDLAKAPANDTKAAAKALDHADKMDRKSTKVETYLKNAGYVLALFGTVAFAFASFSFAPFVPMIALGATLYGTAFLGVSVGAALEANRNQNQTIGLRRILINNISESQALKVKNEKVENVAVISKASSPQHLPSKPAPSNRNKVHWADKISEEAHKNKTALAASR